MTAGRGLNAKLFLEGIEVPLIGATFTHTVNTAAIAYIDIIPLETINHIKPRTMVHLFVKDYQNPPNYPYVLGFEGEVFGISFSKTPTSRSMTLSCIDFSSYWDNALVYFFNPLQSLGKGGTQLQVDGQNINETQKQDIKVEVINSITSWLVQQVSSGKGDLLDGIIHLYKDIALINDFYKHAEDKLRITERIKLRSSGAIKNLLDQQKAKEWFTGIVGRNNGMQTLRMVLQDLMGLVFHDFVSVPFPSRINNPKVSWGDESGTTIGNFIFKPNMYMLPPPACNIFFPDEYSSFTYNRNFFQEPTRLIYQPEIPFFGGESNVVLPHTFAPESFAWFMSQSKKPMPTTMIGSESLQVARDKYGRYGDADTGDSGQVNGKRKKEPQFLTNEELMKGILLAQEGMAPATSQFRSSLTQFGNRELARKIAQYLFFKKRFQGRELQITSHLKMSVVPGFTVLVVDDSDANQTLIAYCNSVTHRIYANQGGYTNVQLSYARDVNEQDITSGKAGEPLIPPWFDQTLFGSMKDGKLEVAKNLDLFYAELLGTKGCSSMTSVGKTSYIVEAAKTIRDAYRRAKRSGVSNDVPDLIRSVTARDYVGMRDTMSFINGETLAGDDRDPFQAFAGFNYNSVDEERRKIIITYRDLLHKFRGFRG